MPRDTSDQAGHPDSLRLAPRGPFAAVLADPGTDPGSPVGLCLQLWVRCVAVYPDLATGGIGIVNPHGVDYADIRPALAASRDAVSRYLRDSLSPQDACEWAWYSGYTDGQIVAMLRKLVAARGLPASQWPEPFVRTMAAHATDQAERYPEHLLRIGMGRGPYTPDVPLDEELAGAILMLGGGYQDGYRAIEARRDAYHLPMEDATLHEHMEGACRLVGPVPEGVRFDEWRMRIVGRGRHGE